VPDLKTTPFAQSVLAFVREVAQATTWDADEGTFPVHAILRQIWERGEDNSDYDNDGDNNDDNDDNCGLGEDPGGAGPVPYEIERL
jgi:hypothetical protein